MAKTVFSRKISDPEMLFLKWIIITSAINLTCYSNRAGLQRMWLCVEF